VRASTRTEIPDPCSGFYPSKKEKINADVIFNGKYQYLRSDRAGAPSYANRSCRNCGKKRSSSIETRIEIKEREETNREREKEREREREREGGRERERESLSILGLL